jgi:RNA polymerase sigma factor (sigma-70 family)
MLMSIRKPLEIRSKTFLRCETTNTDISPSNRMKVNIKRLLSLEYKGVLEVITETLVNQARDGDKDSFIRLFESIELDMYKMARSMLPRDQDCQDVMQETTLKAYQSIASLQKPEFFKTWVFRILINECNALLRMQLRRNETVTDDQEINAAECATLPQEYENIELYEAIEELDVSLRMVVSLYYFQDMPVKEIVSILNLSETAVKSRLYRARHQLALALYTTPNRERKMNYGTIS